MKGGMGGNTIGGILGFISIDKDSFRIIHPPWESSVMMIHKPRILEAPSKFI